MVENCELDGSCFAACGSPLLPPGFGREKGKSLPDLSVLLPLSELFGVSADELLGGEPPAGRWEAEWHRAIRAGDPGRAAITALLPSSRSS